MSVFVKCKVIVSDPDDLDEVSVAVSNSITGFTLENITSALACVDFRDKDKTVQSWLLHVEGQLEHLNGFDDLEEFQNKFID